MPGMTSQLPDSLYERWKLLDADPIGKLLWSRMVVIDDDVVVVPVRRLLELCDPINATITIVVPRWHNGRSARMRVFGMPRVSGRVISDRDGTVKAYSEGTAIVIATQDIRRCYLAHLDQIEAVAVRLAESALEAEHVRALAGLDSKRCSPAATRWIESDQISEAPEKWMDEYRQLLETVSRWSSPRRRLPESFSKRLAIAIDMISHENKAP
jgi:hypothetical protein